MARLGLGRRQLASLLWKASVEDEVDAEFSFHVEMRTREYIERGMDPAAARAAAVARFGNIGNVNAACRTIGNSREREMKRTEYLSELAHDIRFAARQLLKTPTFTIVAVMTLALGVGATTAIFSAVEAVVLRPFPFPNTERIAFVWTHWLRMGNGGASAGDYDSWRKGATSFEAMAAFSFKGVSVASGDSPERITGALATASMFAVFGIKPQLGRVFTEDDDQPGHDNVVVLADGFWRRSFAGDRNIVGRAVTLNGRPYTVIGVMPPGYDPTDSHEEMWTPIAFAPDRLTQHDEHFLTIVGRIKRGVPVETAQRELDIVGKRLSADFPMTNKENSPLIQDYRAAVIGDYRSRLFVLLGAVACVLLIACGNVANLLLARGAARSKELAIRTAIGAGRGRILRQLLTESLVLAFVATAIGLMLAWAGVHVLVGAAPANIPRLSATRVDGWVLLFALGLAVVSSVLFGLMPAFRSTRGDLQSSLREGGRSALASARDRVRSVLIVTEVAIALTLLVGAGLLIRSAMYLSHVDPGFDLRGVLTARVAMRPAEYKQGAEEAEVAFNRIVAELRARPGVQSVAVTSQAPLGPGGGSNGLLPEGRSMDPANLVEARMRMVTPGFLATMKIPLLSGRDINEQDIRGGVRVMVVSAALAKAAWPNENAIGKRVACCEGTPEDPRYKTVVGVAADVRTQGPTQNIRPEFYVPMVQAPAEAWSWINRTMSLVARAQVSDATTLTPTIRAVVKSVDPSLTVYNIATMDERLRQSVAESRFHLMLVTTLGVVGLLLAAAGIYSVIAYFVTLRTQEIGVRMALGATPGDVMRLLTWEGLRPVVIGAVLGGFAAAWATRLLRGSLYGIGATDPLTFVAVTAVLLAVSVCTILIPARRATSVDPTMALHG